MPSTASATNSTLSGLTGTLTLTNPGGPQSIDLSTIENAADFAGTLGALTGVDATVTASGVSFDNATEAFTIGGSDASALGFASGNTQAETTNASLGGLSGTLTIGDDTLTFGSNDGAGEINTRAEFETALANLTTPELEASIDGTTNQLTISATGDPNTTFEVGGTVGSPWEAFGISKTTYTGTSSALTSYSGPNSFFFNLGEGQGNSEYSTLGVDSVEFVSLIADLIPGGSYDTEDQRVEIEVPEGISTITGEGARKFELEPGAYAVNAVPNPERAEFIDQYNEIIRQIDDLAEDSGFNGVNLLDGDDLSVIFNEDGSSGLDIAGEPFDAAGLGLSSLTSDAFDTEHPSARFWAILTALSDPCVPRHPNSAPTYRLWRRAKASQMPPSIHWKPALQT